MTTKEETSSELRLGIIQLIYGQDETNIGRYHVHTN